MDTSPSVLVFKDEPDKCERVETGVTAKQLLPGDVQKAPTLFSSRGITHSVIYQLPTKAHCAASSVGLNCIGIASLIEQK